MMNNEQHYSTFLILKKNN